MCGFLAPVESLSHETTHQRSFTTPTITQEDDLHFMVFSSPMCCFALIGKHVGCHIAFWRFPQQRWIKLYALTDGETVSSEA